MYEDLNQIAQLKFNKEMESISGQSREKVKKLQNIYAALAGPSSKRSGQNEASIGRVQIDGAEQMVRALYRIWVDLIRQRKGHISRPDIPFIVDKVDGYARTQKGHLHTAFSHQRMGAVINVMVQEAEIRMSAVSADTRRDLEIMVREHEAFPKEMVVKQLPVTLDVQIPIRNTRHYANVLNVLIASPSDINEERDVVTQSIYQWNDAHFSTTGIVLTPVRWESHSYPASGARPQAIVNKQIVESGDILIGIFGYKLGTPTGAAQSGTIEEIEEFRKAGKHVALYFSTADIPRNADRSQLAALETYKKERQRDTLYFEFGDSQALREHLTRHLPKIVHEVSTQLGFSDPVQQQVAAVSPQRHPHTPEFLPELSAKEMELLVSAARDSSGQISCRRAIGGDQFFVGSQNLLASPSPRSVAELIGAIRSLVSFDLLEEVGRNGEFYKVTNSGYAAADLLADFTRWSSHQVTIEARYFNAQPESLTVACSGVVQLPAVYYEYRVRAGADVMRSEKEPRSLLVEGVDPAALNELSWQPTDLVFVVSGTNETKSFLIERTEDRRIVKFHIKS